MIGELFAVLPVALLREEQNILFQWVSTSLVFYAIKGGIGYHLGKLKVEDLERAFIGNDVWIGNRVIIMQGVIVGTGAVIGVGAVVTKDVPPYAVFTGVPTRVIKYRFDKETINRLLDSECWLIPNTQLKHLAKYMDSPYLLLDKINNTNREEGQFGIVLLLLICLVLFVIFVKKRRRAAA